MRNILITLALLVSGSAWASGPDEAIREFFQKIENGKYEEAIVGSLSKAYESIGAEPDLPSIKANAETLIGQFKQVGKAYGKIRGYDLIVERSLGSKYKIMKYAAYYDAEPVEVKFVLYAPQGIWGIRNISINSYLEDEFKKDFESKYE